MSLKKFEIQEMIAKGGMAEVYRAKTTGFQGFEKEVCVKKILPHLTEDESFVNMFINEAKLAATLTYANIVSVHDLCVSANGEYFIVMEYVHGKDLSDVIRAAQLGGREVPPDIAVFVAREMCKGLYYAHTKTDSTGAPLSIIHRDISPHNVLVSFMGEVKLTDFGIAKASSIANKTAIGILKGKYGYMSPEQARGQPLDHRSDIFNTGIVLYELLVGERCFAGSSDFSTLNLMRNAVVTPPTKINANISRDLEAIVLKALSADRNDRYKDALELEQALAKYAEKAGKRAQAVELSAFMKQLFSAPDDKKQGSSTGVLNLASVVGPAPVDEKPAKSEVKPRRATERAAELADRPIEKAPEPPPPPPAPPPAAAEERVPEKRDVTLAKPKTAEKKPEKIEKPEKAKSVEKVDKAEKADKAEKPEKVEKAKAEEKPSADEAKAESAKVERKPARLKPADDAEKPAAKAEKPEKPEKPAAKAEAADDDKKKKGGKQLSDAPKRPVGRKELKPGLTQVGEKVKRERRFTFVRAAAVIIVASAIGVGAGVYRARQSSRQKTFRDMELATREGPAKKATVTVLVSTEPPGAQVRLDNVELSDRTPLVVERDRDAVEHELELTLEGFKTTKRKLKYEPGPVTRVTERLAGEPGTLKVTSKPSEQPVKVDGKLAGNTPLTMELPSGRREVEIGDDTRELVKTTVDVKPGKVTALSKRVPAKGVIGSIRISSEPAAQIFVDDEPTGRWTNEGALDLEPEVPHKVSLVVGSRTTGAKKDGEEKKKHELTVKLRRGEKRELYLDLGGSS